MSKLERAIAKAIVSAQIASDAGKGKYILETKGNNLSSIRQLGYATKDGFISEAVNLCKLYAGKAYHYYVESGFDQHGVPSFIIYFDTKIDGKRRQISFHSFNKKLWKGIKGSGRITRWDREPDGSRDTAQFLIDYYDL